MPAKNQKLEKPPTPWAKRRKMPSALTSPVPTKGVGNPPVSPEPNKPNTISSLSQALSEFSGGANIDEVVSDTELDAELEEFIAENPEVLDKDNYEDIDLVTLPEPSKVTLSKPTVHRKAQVPGRRPDYTHALIGLSVGDELIFHKNPKIRCEVIDLETKVSFRGIEFEGIISAAERAYLVSGLTPPKRITGLSEWQTTNGVRLRTLYEAVPKVTVVSNLSTTI